MPRFNFVHQFARGGLPVFFSWDNIYSKKTWIRAAVFRAVVSHPEIREAHTDGWTAAMIA